MKPRRFAWFECEGSQLAASIDEGQLPVGLLIVSGGNELRSGSHGSHADLAAHIANAGFSVLRFDRRGVGESEGTNNGYLSSAKDLACAIAAFKREVPNIHRLLGYGNCDGATALALFGRDAGIDGLALANPWLYEDEQAPAAPAPEAIRARYSDRLRSIGFYRDLLTGKINLGKALRGLKGAAAKAEADPMAARFRESLVSADIPVRFLLAEKDTTARTFRASWDSADYSNLKNHPKCELASIDSASHSFASKSDAEWLRQQLIDLLQAA